ncbi:VP1/VP3 family protein [Sulfolobus islandicus L.S.2.15]|uniref:VP1/VP3 family protein n=1 Tax=Saccharolobus islandicus (strain L.S.2.15 / Lassen \|nr:V1/V3 family capsid protein [Sulfolobus islandicus]ACP34300.1 VP1/VP3 family protein [Sulfolobus islandicus L.S.2.15]
MEISLKTIIFLVLFIVLGTALLSPIVSYVNLLTTPSFTTVSGTVTQTNPNPQYVGSSNAPILQLVPLFYILVLIIVPAVVAYKIYKD